MANPDADSASFHARLRWVGAPLLLSGFIMLMWALSLLSRGGSGLTVMFGLFGCGMALASFGANHDTALALAIRSGGGGKLAPKLAREVSEELEVDRSGTMALRASPRIAMALPLVALMVQSFVFWRLFTGA
jgi:hypothetical protein